MRLFAIHEIPGDGSLALRSNSCQLLSQSPQIVAEFFVEGFQTCGQFLLLGFISTRSYQNLVAICSQLKWSVGRDLKHVQNWLVNDEGKTIAVFDQHVLRSPWHEHLEPWL